MAISHTTAVRNGIADFVVDRVDAGAGAGTLVFQTSGDVEVATLTFSTTAFGAAASGIATAATITSDTSATGGTIAKFRIFDSNALEVLSGTAGSVGTEDIVLSTATIGSGDTVSCSSLTYTAPA